MRAVLAMAAVAAMSGAVPAVAGDVVAGTIGSFECGDNCYLTITSDAGTDLTGLCAAEACQPWNEEVAMPDDLIGRAVLVTVGIGSQFDGEGTERGPFTAFTQIEFVR